jgi:hypothetical protein
MKMRKLLPLVLLAVGALFMLSGCDAMLDAIFQDNQITVDVFVTIPPYPGLGQYYYDWYYGTGTVTLTLYDVTAGTNKVVVSGRTGYTSTASHFVFPFTKLKSDTYMVTAVYTSAYYSSPGPNSIFYDPSGTIMGSPFSSIAMPYVNAGDSTGRSANISMYF